MSEYFVKANKRLRELLKKHGVKLDEREYLNLLLWFVGYGDDDRNNNDERDELINEALMAAAEQTTDLSRDEIMKRARQALRDADGFKPAALDALMRDMPRKPR